MRFHHFLSLLGKALLLTFVSFHFARATGFKDAEISQLPPEVDFSLLELQAREPVLRAMLTRMLKLSRIKIREMGQDQYWGDDGLAYRQEYVTGKYTNNKFFYPEDKNPLDPGRRFWILDVDWFELNATTEAREHHHAGFEVQMNYDQNKRAGLRQLFFCQTAESCERYGFPFAEDPKKVVKTWSTGLELSDCSGVNIENAMADLPRQDAVYRMAFARMIADLADYPELYLDAHPFDALVDSTVSPLIADKVANQVLDMRSWGSSFLRRQRGGFMPSIRCWLKSPINDPMDADQRRVMYLAGEKVGRVIGLRVEYMRYGGGQAKESIRRSLVSLSACFTLPDCQAMNIVGKIPISKK